jgi:hypothetical protein
MLFRTFKIIIFITAIILIRIFTEVVAIVDSIMKEEDAQRIGKTVDRVRKRTILSQCVEQETNRLIIKIKEV